MSEIDLVYSSIKAFFEASGQQDVTSLVHVLEPMLSMAEMRSYEFESQAGRRYLDKMQNKDYIAGIEKLRASLSSSEVPTIAQLP